MYILMEYAGEGSSLKKYIFDWSLKHKLKGNEYAITETDIKLITH